MDYCKIGVVLIIVIAAVITIGSFVPTDVEADDGFVDCADVYGPGCGQDCLLTFYEEPDPTNPAHVGTCMARMGGGCFCYNELSKNMPWYGGSGPDDYPVNYPW